MRALYAPYAGRLLPFFIFVASGIAAIAMQQPLFMLLPFTWVLFPLLYDWLIVQPEKLFWGLCILLPLSTELTITPQLGLDFPDELLLLFLTGIVIVKIIHRPSWFPVSLRKSSLFMLLVIHLLWIAICCFYSVEPLLSIKFLLARTWYVVPLVILPQVLVDSQSKMKKLAWCFLAPMLFIVIQVLIRQSLDHFSFADVKKAMAPFFRNHVTYSSMLVCLLPVAWCCWKLTPASNPNRKWIMLGIGIGLAALLFSYSRGAWVALVLGIATIWIIQKKLVGAFVMLAIAGVLISTVWLVTDKNYLRFAPDHDRTIFIPISASTCRQRLI
jgi:O-antigen ligase